MQNAAIMPLQIVKNRFYSFAEDISRIWADFWIACYGKRGIKIKDSDGVKYFAFDSERLRGLIINAKIEVGTGTVYSERECVSTLLNLFEKGIINICKWKRVESNLQFPKRFGGFLLPIF